MFGLGKARSLYGEFIDENNVKQEDVAKFTGLSRNTISEICNNQDYKVHRSTKTLLLLAVKELTGKKVTEAMFWPKK